MPAISKFYGLVNGLTDWNSREVVCLSRTTAILISCVCAVKPLDGLRVHVVFTDGSEREIDLDPYLHGPIFEPIRRNRDLFASVYVDPDSETLTWPNGADIDPDVLYYDGNPPWAIETASDELSAIR